MRVRLAEQILELFGIKGGPEDEYGCTHKSDQYQLAYKVGDMIINDASDATILRQVFERNLLPKEKCKKCGKDLEYFYSDNGVLDSAECPDYDSFRRRHK